MLNLKKLVEEKYLKKQWVMLTAYDAPTAEILESAGVDWILVGDSLGMVVLGYESTAPVTMDEMIHHAKAVRRGAPKSFVIGDLPLKGVEKGPRQTLESAKRFVKEAGCDAVKFEWSAHALKNVDLLTKNKIPVMGHLGLTPQTAKDRKNFRAQGTSAQSALEILDHALLLEKHGVFAVLLECVPSAVAKVIAQKLKVPVIGIGAGADCDGQVLVFQDLVGLFRKFKPRFVKRYANFADSAQSAVEKFIREVGTGRFPGAEHSFKMGPEELKEFLCQSKR